MIHQWIYVIIPVDMAGNWEPNKDGYGGYYPYHTRPVFCAFCKACRQYFSEPVEFGESGYRLSPSNLPRYGCEPISDDVAPQ